MKKYFLFLFQTLLIVSSGLGQSYYTGKVIDSYYKAPVSNAEVTFLKSGEKTTTDNWGHFALATSSDEEYEDSSFDLSIVHNRLLWRTKMPANIRIVNLMGQETGLSLRSVVGQGELNLDGLPEGIYLLNYSAEGKSKVFKMWKSALSAQAFSEKKSYYKSTPTAYETSDTIMVSKSGFFTQKYPFPSGASVFELLKTSYSDIEFFDKLIRPEAFTLLEGLPLNPVYSEVKSVKVVYSILDKKIYFTNSNKYFIHYEFAAQRLGYKKGHSTFNIEQYSNNPNRIYILATLNHFTSSDIYTLDFFAGDDLTCDQIETVYKKVAETTFVGDKLRFYANSQSWKDCANVPSISADELYKGQNYQPLNPQESYGYLKKVDVNQLDDTYLSRHDIVLLNGIPADIAVVAGIITTDFQTPLSHVNVLSHNRGTPNMALRDGWENPKLGNLIDKLVYLKVTLDSFIVREASLAEAQAFWQKKEPQTPQSLDLDTLTTGLVDLSMAGVGSVSTIGGKAANFAELAKISVTGYGKLPLPEGAFAIPMYYYWQHLRRYGLHHFIDQLLNDNRFKTDAKYRQEQLEVLRDSIKKSPVDKELLELVNLQIAPYASFKNFRFRSSTNSEDITGFNGAGLYDSYTGIIGDKDKTIEKAIRKTWASLWNYAAFEERDYFKIDHRSVAMAVLVHRSFPAEAANGVVITKNLYNPYNPAITINVQVGEISVVKPTDEYLPDQIICYNFAEADDVIEYINHSNVPGMEGKTVMTDEEIRELKDLCMGIHYHYCRLNAECRPMDIEFKVDIVDGKRKLYIKQARPYM